MDIEDVPVFREALTRITADQPRHLVVDRDSSGSLTAWPAPPGGTPGTVPDQADEECPA